MTRTSLLWSDPERPSTEAEFPTGRGKSKSAVTPVQAGTATRLSALPNLLRTPEEGWSIGIFLS
jgi:hypothetical protein